jgi:hypothetical protein
MEMQKDAQKKHHEVLEMIERLSEETASERASMVGNLRGFHCIDTYHFTDKWTLFLVVQ